MADAQAARRQAVKVAFGRALRLARERQALSQEALGHESETGRTFVSQLERAEKGVSLAIVFDLASALGVKPSKLVAAVEAELSHGKGRAG